MTTAQSLIFTGLIALAACGDDESTKTTRIGEVRIGACGAPSGQGDFVHEFIVASCTGEHALEVAGKYTLPDGDYPGSSRLRFETQRDCMPIFEQYVGRSYWSSDYDIRVVYPAPSNWASGERTVICMVIGEDGEPLTEPARGSGN